MNGTENKENTPVLIKDVLAYFKDARNNEPDWESNLNTYRQKVLTRLEVIERAVPFWLDFVANHPLMYAVRTWGIEDFAILIGRGAVYPSESTHRKLFKDGEEVWLVAQKGLGHERERRGRPSKVNEHNQFLIYDYWSRGMYTQEELAKMFKVGIATIKRIISKWKVERNI
jgi:hypothetical protein